MSEPTEAQEPMFITFEKAADLLGKTTQSVRQYVQRRKIDCTRERGKVLLHLDSVLSYYARKKNLPAWESHIHNIKHKTFVSLEFASKALMVQPSYILQLIRTEKVEGYVTSSGDVMVVKDSINNYLRTPSDATDSL